MTYFCCFYPLLTHNAYCICVGKYQKLKEEMQSISTGTSTQMSEGIMKEQNDKIIKTIEQERAEEKALKVANNYNKSTS